MGVSFFCAWFRFLSKIKYFLNSIGAKVDKLNQWYKDMPSRQRKFVYFVSLCLVPVFLIGVAPLVLLIYLHLGQDSDSDDKGYY